MTPHSEPKAHSGKCSYCGDSPVNHSFTYFSNLISSFADSHMAMITKHAPLFLEKIADLIPGYMFRGLHFLGFVSFSNDIEKTNTFRSRVIWEEARARGIPMQHVILFKKPIDWYKATINNKKFFFESIPLPPESQYKLKDWDNKLILKKELLKHHIPVPAFKTISLFSFTSLHKIFSSLSKPLIVKPETGSRGRHTVTTIETFEHFKNAISIAQQISPRLIVEEHLYGDVYRATLINGVLMGFYRGGRAEIKGDGISTIKELIDQKDNARNARVEKVRITDELMTYLSQAGYTLESILPFDMTLSLTHRTGRLFGGTTKEMIDQLHPSFIPILEEAARITTLKVCGFDCIIVDPTQPQNLNRWGIIECNTLPFIDLHYYALEGTPYNITGAIWDMWQKN